MRRRMLMQNTAANAVGGMINPSEAENGVYVYAKNGLLSSVADWDTTYNDNAVGVAVITDNAKFVIKKGIGSTYQTYWSTSLYGVTVGSVYATDKTAAIADYAGYSNTQIIHEAAPDESVTNNAANYCLAQTITVNDSTVYGYLPSAGEVYEIYNNFEAINSALELIGSDSFDSNQYGLCSTSQDDYNAWRIILGTGSGAGISKNVQATDVYAIPIFSLE